MNVRSDESRLTGAPTHGDMTIRLSNISKFYSGVPALLDVSAEFYEGEVHAILGENGAGKSTLINIISGALQPELGVIEFEGSRVSSMSPETAASLGISISFQHPAVLDDLSVLENFQVALASFVVCRKVRTDRCTKCARRSRPAPPVANTRRCADGRPKALARNRQGLGDQAEGADPRRADGFARSSGDRHAF